MSGDHIAERVWGTLKLGGRITKYKGQAASYAPGTGLNIVSTFGSVLERAAARHGSSVSARAISLRAFAVALVAATPIMLSVTGTRAGACVETFAGSGIFVCSGAAGGDAQQSLSPPAGGALVVTTDPGFGITTAAGDAINLRNLAADTNITFTDNNASAITGNGDGIDARNSGPGFVSITTTGIVRGTTRDGITVDNRSNGTSLTIDTQSTVTGQLQGIDANNAGSGALSITTQAVTGTTRQGIYAYNGAYDSLGSTNLTINAKATVTGQYEGIYARNYGTGFLSITTQAVTGAREGINAYNGSLKAVSYGYYGTNLTINAKGTVTGGQEGIYARNYGTGFLSITTQAVTGTTRQGIKAYNGSYDAFDYYGLLGTNLTINAKGTVIGDDQGIYASNYGTGFLSITTQAVTGTTRQGIYAYNYDKGTSLTITAKGDVTGNSEGIEARNFGTGALSITTEAVTGTTRRGIYARNNNGTSLTINAQGTVTGDDEGIRARNNGSGALSITTQAVTGGAGFAGIYSRNNGTSLTILAKGAIRGGTDGINARNFGSAGLTITVNDDVDGNTGQGIKAFNSANDVSASVLITQAAGTITLGELNGIYTDNSGGSLTINALGTSIGQADDGIRAFNRAGTTNLTITTNVATGKDRGIYANNAGSGVLSITATGAITGDTSYGISALTGAGDTTQITLNAGAAVSSTAGLGIFNDAGDSTTTVNTGASVAGIIRLGDGSDNLNFNGGDFSAVTLFDGGDDTAVADTFIDTLTFAGSSGAVTGANVVNWENVVIGAGSTISFAGNALTTGSLAINGGGILDATGGALALTSNLTNNGIINARDGAANDTITVSGNYTGTGELRLDVDFTTDVADTLVVNGNVTGGATTISVNDISTGTASGNDILVVDVTGTSNAGDFVLGAPGIGAFSFTLAQIGNDFFLQQQAGFNPASPTYESLPQVLLDLNTLPTLAQRATNRGGSNGAGIQPAGGKSDRYIPGSANYANKQSSPIWARLEGVRSSVDSARSTTGSSYDVNQWKIRLGVDGLFQKNDKGSWLVGLNAFYSMADTDISSATGNGSIDTKGFGLGLTTTWYGNDGYYVDGQAQLSRFSSDLRDVTSGALVSNNKGMGYAFGLEAGRRMATGTGWTITPQARLIYSSIRFDSFTGPGATVVSLDDGDSLKGRVGFNLDQKRHWTAADGRTGNSRLYTLANIYYEFSDKSQVDISGVKFTSRPDRLSGEIGLGGSLNWNNGQYAVFSEVSTATSLNNFGDSYQLKGTAGIRVKF